MSDRHFKFWPAHAMRSLAAPATNLFYNAEVSARRYPDKPFLVFYDTAVTFADLLDEAERVAGAVFARRTAAREVGSQIGDRRRLLGLFEAADHARGARLHRGVARRA